MSIERPKWLPTYLPELDGVRGLAILSVVLYHCHPRLEGTCFYRASLWGWAGVTVFFFLSGFLITSNLLTARDRKHYFHNFHGRRALRIWPLYILLLIVCYLNSEWFIGPPIWQAVKAAPWLAYLFFVQNLFHLTLPPAIGPTWALAIEEQYYFVWAPAVRWLRRPWMLAVLLSAAVVASPLVRHSYGSALTPTHTLIHLDGLAFGSLLAIGIYTLGWSQKLWRWLGVALFLLGISAAATVAGGTAYLDSALAFGLGGGILAIATLNGARNPFCWLLRRGPLPFYGKVSYGLYLCHIAVFIYFGSFDLKMNPYGMWGNLAIVAMRLAMSTALAAGLWYGVESQILKLKRHF
ncbi:acyltransferase family protein [Telmatobacter bradus]|uniref:acyltransferase family protein n=1 Tax=Telmatobacter bradus TaxID=474953 RepID=UPI003B42B38A